MLLENHGLSPCSAQLGAHVAQKATVTNLSFK